MNSESTFVKPFPLSFFRAIASFAIKAMAVGLFMALSLLFPAWASDLPLPFTIDLPFADNVATPAWLGHPVSPATTFASLNLPIQPPDPNASLLVTVYFTEKEGGFLRITWKETGTAHTLSDNFYEGIAMSNQRSLLISPETMANAGMLSFQSGSGDLGIQRIRLEWLEDKTGLVSPAVEDTLVTPSLGPTLTAQTLSGQPQVIDPAAWHEQVVTVPITDVPQRIEDGLEFSVQLDSVPKSGRLSFKEAGLPMGKHLVVWINEHRAGTVTPGVSDLADDGYLSSADGSNAYVGWRDGSFFIPVAFLQTGMNTLQFSDEDELPSAQSSTTDSTTPATEAPLALKDLVLQLAYPAQQAPPSQPPTTNSSVDGQLPDNTAPTGEILPLTSSTLTLRTTTP